MKKSPDLSATLSKGAAEAKEILHNTAGLIEAEWQRLKDSETVPDQVKTAMHRFGDAVETVKREASTTAEGLSKDLAGTIDEVRDFVTTMGPQVVASAGRVARQAGVPIPDGWLPDESDDESDDVADDVSDTVADEAKELAEDVSDTVAEVTDTVADEVQEAADEADEAADEPDKAEAGTDEDASDETSADTR